MATHTKEKTDICIFLTDLLKMICHTRVATKSPNTMEILLFIHKKLPKMYTCKHTL